MHHKFQQSKFCFARWCNFVSWIGRPTQVNTFWRVNLRACLGSRCNGPQQTVVIRGAGQGGTSPQEGENPARRSLTPSWEQLHKAQQTRARRETPTPEHACKILCQFTNLLFTLTTTQCTVESFLMLNIVTIWQFSWYKAGTQFTVHCSEFGEF